MGIEIIQHHADNGRLGITAGTILHAAGKINLGEPTGDVHLAKTAFRFADHF